MEEENKYINKKKYNIAILLPTLDRGGAERVATELSHYFHERNYNVYLFVNKFLSSLTNNHFRVAAQNCHIKRESVLEFGRSHNV